MPDPKKTPDEITEERADDWDQQDEEVRQITQTIVPRSDAPPRAGITESGSGADQQGV